MQIVLIDDEYIVKALELDAKDYIVKQNYENIVPALKTVHPRYN